MSRKQLPLKLYQVCSYSDFAGRVNFAILGYQKVWRRLKNGVEIHSCMLVRSHLHSCKVTVMLCTSSPCPLCRMYVPALYLLKVRCIRQDMFLKMFVCILLCMAVRPKVSG